MHVDDKCRLINNELAQKERTIRGQTTSISEKNLKDISALAWFDPRPLPFKTKSRN